MFKLSVRKVLICLLIIFSIMIFNIGLVYAVETGNASWYGDSFHGKETASGEKFNMYDYTAAHRTHTFGTKLKVTNLANNKSVIVRVNDRGPYVKTRIIDLSKRAFADIASLETGVIKVSVEIVSDASESDSEDSFTESDDYLNLDDDMTTEESSYRIQFGAFVERSNAVTYAKHLIELGIIVKIYKFKYKTGEILYKVISENKFDSRKLAKKYEQTYKDMGIDCFIVNLRT